LIVISHSLSRRCTPALPSARAARARAIDVGSSGSSTRDSIAGLAQRREQLLLPLELLQQSALRSARAATSVISNSTASAA
jgi:hypothetical protein